MFIQYRPWLDCDRRCPFCYITEKDRNISLADKRLALMKLSCVLHYSSQGSDTIGLIGGELFSDPELYREWVCVAESIRNADHIKRVFVGTHLLCDVDLLLDFAHMLNKEVQICTSYDPKGRFLPGDYEKWKANIVEVQKEGYRVVVSSTFTEALFSDPNIPIEDVDYKLQPIFYTEDWLKDVAARISTPEEYHSDLLTHIAPGILAQRQKALDWFNAHKDIANDYSRYDDKHATILYDFKDGEYVQSSFVCTNYLAPCGHPMIARYYADSDKCTMCDAKAVSEL